MRKAAASLIASLVVVCVLDARVAVSQGAPVANLPLTCPSAGAIGQPQGSCSNLVYQSPSPELIVLRGPASAPTWARASTLASADTVVVCTLPVAPGTYSSCRDSSGARRIAYAPTTTVFPDAPPPGAGTGSSPGAIAVVAASGGDYADPLAAVSNASQGDAWCRSSGDDPARTPCVISIAPGIYELASTLVVPAHVAVVGHGPHMTVLTARAGVAVTLQLGTATLDPSFDVALRDLAVENRAGGGGGTAVALDIVDNSNVEVSNVRAAASGASENIGVRYEGRTINRLSDMPLVSRLKRPVPIRLLEAIAAGGSTSVGFKIVRQGAPKIEQCAISASEASTTNIGVESNGGATLDRCEVFARGGVTAIAMSIVGMTGLGGAGASSEVADSKLVVEGASTENTGYYSRGTYGAIFKGVEVLARGAGAVTGISLSQSLPFGEGLFDDVDVLVYGGSTNVGMYTEGGHHDGFSMTVVDSRFQATAGGPAYGMRFGGGAPEGTRMSVSRSSIGGWTAALFSDAPFVEWGASGVGPPLIITVADSSIGAIDLNRHYLNCVAVISGGQFYPDTCPPGDWTPSPR